MSFLLDTLENVKENIRLFDGDGLTPSHKETIVKMIKRLYGVKVASILNSHLSENGDGLFYFETTAKMDECLRLMGMEIAGKVMFEFTGKHVVEMTLLPDLPH